MGSRGDGSRIVLSAPSLSLLGHPWLPPRDAVGAPVSTEERACCSSELCLEARRRKSSTVGSRPTPAPPRELTRPHWGGFSIPSNTELWNSPRQRSAVAGRVGGEGAEQRTEIMGGGACSALACPPWVHSALPAGSFPMGTVSRVAPPSRGGSQDHGARWI